MLILDEPTEGIQPSVIKDIAKVIQLLRDRGDMAIVLVEQYLEFAAELADEFIILERGRVVTSGAGHELADSREAKELLAI
jgi:urea transport system ATP-binding protein